MSSRHRHIQQNALHSIAPKAPFSSPFAVQPNQQVSKSKRAANLQKRDSVELEGRRRNPAEGPERGSRRGSEIASASSARLPDEPIRRADSTWPDRAMVKA